MPIASDTPIRKSPRMMRKKLIMLRDDFIGMDHGLAQRQSQQRGRGNGIEHRHVGENLDDLKTARQPELGDQMWRQTGDVAVVKDDAAAVRLLKSGDRAECGGLAGAIGTDQRHDLSSVDGKLKIVHGYKTAEPPREVFDLENGHSFHP